jgi:hypothetical protein
MNRPARKLKHLEEKLANKTERSRKRGKRAKRWNKSLQAYKPLVA